MKIITNNQSRLLNDDFTDTFTYGGYEYALSDFDHISSDNTQFAEWDGVLCDSYFSGILVRFVPNDPDRVVVGRFYQ